MKLGVGKNKDLWGGAMLVGIGTAAALIARNYDFGSTSSMGPGYFPTVLGIMLILFGIYVIFMGLRSNETFKGKWPLRPLIVLSISIVLFGVLMKISGLLPALVVLIFGSAAAGKEFKFVEVLLLALALVGFSVAVFIWGLRLPFPLIKGF
jgi:hypothetical protein